MLKVGDKIPILKGINQDGKELLINDFEGDKLIVFIYPKDSTPGCTTEACNLRDNYELLMSKGFKDVRKSFPTYLDAVRDALLID